MPDLQRQSVDSIRLDAGLFAPAAATLRCVLSEECLGDGRPGAGSASGYTGAYEQVLLDDRRPAALAPVTHPLMRRRFTCFAFDSGTAANLFQPLAQ